MTYEELQIGQKIKIKERVGYEGEKPRTVQKCYTVTAKYPCMCMVEEAGGHRRGLSMGDLIINNIIEQSADIEAIRKNPCKNGWRKKG